jgi:hypothetical protein
MINNKDKDYRPEPVDVSDIRLPDSLERLSETIAKNVHEVWAKSRLEDGWTYGTERNDIAKTHPHLIPYEELPESEKDYDRNTAIGTLKLIIKLGFTIKIE